MSDSFIKKSLAGQKVIWLQWLLVRPQEAEPCETWDFKLIKDTAESHRRRSGKAREDCHKRNVVIVVEQFSFGKMKIISHLLSSDVMVTAEICQKMVTTMLSLL